MGDNSTAVSSVIPFRSAKLLLVERDGQPFVPMKPVVEGMGLDWKSQHAKLQGGRFNSVMVMITTTGADGKRYEMACLPLRKLAGWLMSIHASKVRPELRDGVIAYQNECDDALWSYWNEGHAVNHRAPGQTMTVLGQTIGTDGFHMLGALIKGKVSSLSSPVQRRATAKIWAQTHAAFGVRSAADIPADQLDSARNFIAAYNVLEGEFIAKEQPRRQLPLNINYPIEAITCRRPDMLIDRGEGHAWLDVSLDDLRENFTSPCEMILSELTRAGYEVEGAWWELRTYRNKIYSFMSFAQGISRVAEDPKRYAIKTRVAA
ncbi:phage antirepressor N-terminal domain-containing protein [Pseudomonas putida]|nr:phage antirepressor N-terminal domain-containing protein [Pseudomonas putida]